MPKSSEIQISMNAKQMFDALQNLSKKLEATDTTLKSLDTTIHRLETSFGDLSKTSKNIDALGRGFSNIAMSAVKAHSALNAITNTAQNSSGFSNYEELRGAVTRLADTVRDDTIRKNFESLGTSMSRLGNGLTGISRGFLGTVEAIQGTSDALQSLSGIGLTTLPSISTLLGKLFTDISSEKGLADISKFKEIIDTVNKTGLSVRRFAMSFRELEGVKVTVKPITDVVRWLSNSFGNTRDTSMWSNFEKVTDILKKFGSALRGISSIQKFSGDLNNASKSIRDFMKSFAKVESSQYYAAFDRIANTVHKVAEALKYLKYTSDRTSNAVGRLTEATASAIQPLNLFAGGWRSVLTSLIGGSVIYTLIRAIRSLVTSYAELEDKSRQLNIILGYSEEKLKDVKNRVKEVSSTFGIAATSVMNALYEINQATITGAESFIVMENAVKLSAASGADLVSSARLLSSTIKAFNTSVYNSAYLSGLFFKIQERGIITIEQLTEDFPKLIASASASGISFEDLGAAIATATASGLKANMTMTSFNSTLLRIAKGSKNLNALFRSLGYDSAMAAIRAKGLTYVLTQIQRATGGAVEAIQELGFDYRASRFVTATTQGALLAENMEVFSDKIDTATKATRSLTEASKSIVMQFNKISETIRNSSTDIIEFIANSTGLTGIVRIISDFVTSTNSTVSSVRNMLKYLTKVILGIGTIIFLVGGLRLLLDKLKVTLASTSGFFANLNAALKFDGISRFFRIMRVNLRDLRRGFLSSKRSFTSFMDTLNKPRTGYRNANKIVQSYVPSVFGRIKPGGEGVIGDASSKFVSTSIPYKIPVELSTSRNIKRENLLSLRMLGVLKAIKLVRKGFRSLDDVSFRWYLGITKFLKNLPTLSSMSASSLVLLRKSFNSLRDLPLLGFVKFQNFLQKLPSLSAAGAISLRGLALTFKGVSSAIKGIDIAMVSLSEKVLPLLAAMAIMEGVYWLYEKTKTSISSAIDTRSLSEIADSYNKIKGSIDNAKSSVAKAKLATELIAIQKRLEPLRETMADNRVFQELDRNLNENVQSLQKYVESSEEASNASLELKKRINDLTKSFIDLFSIPYTKLTFITKELIDLQKELQIATQNNDTVAMGELRVSIAEKELEVLKAKNEYLSSIYDKEKSLSDIYVNRNNVSAEELKASYIQDLDKIFAQYDLTPESSPEIKNLYENILSGADGTVIQDSIKKIRIELEKMIQDSANMGDTVARDFVKGFQEGMKDIQSVSSDFSFESVQKESLNNFKGYTNALKRDTANISDMFDIYIKANTALNNKIDQELAKINTNSSLSYSVDPAKTRRYIQTFPEYEEEISKVRDYSKNLLKLVNSTKETLTSIYKSTGMDVPELFSVKREQTISSLKSDYEQLMKIIPEVTKNLENIPEGVDEKINSSIQNANSLFKVLDAISEKAQDHLSKVLEAKKERDLERWYNSSEVPLHIKLINLQNRYNDAVKRTQDLARNNLTGTEEYANSLQKQYDLEEKLLDMRKVDFSNTTRATVESYEIGSKAAMELINKSTGEKLLNYSKETSQNTRGVFDTTKEINRSLKDFLNNPSSINLGAPTSNIVLIS